VTQSPNRRFLSAFHICRAPDDRTMTLNSDSVIIQDPDIHSGEPVFRGTRVPFQTLLDYIEGGETLDEFLQQFPGVTRSQAVAALEEAKALMLARFGK
jgi:uncharacterized protein (DUF433 family)